jgi:curved DNA-binding protein CbpA
MKNHYQTLGINSDASQAEIKASYRKLALKFHPDKNQGDLSSADRFAEIQQAYQILSNTQKRQIFDKFWNIHSAEESGNIIVDEENFSIKREFSWNILFAAVIIVIATVLALRYMVFT